MFKTGWVMINFMKKKIFKFVFLIFILVFIGLFIYNSDTFKEKKEEYKKTQITIKYETISNSEESNNVILEYQEQFDNTDILGELSIPNTSLKVPVAHTDNNEYYLNHLLDKSYNTLGSIFLDYRNEITDRKILIYGHNSQNTVTEFQMLENYVNKDYYDNHNDIYLKTLDDEYHYKIFSIYIAISDYSHVNLKLDGDKYIKHLDWLKEQSIYDTGVLVFDEDILVLQTCYYNPTGSYLIVAAKKV